MHRLALRSSIARLLRVPLRLIPRNADIPVLMGPLGLISKRPRLTWWRAGASSHGCWIGWYEQEVQRALVDLLRPGAVVYDVGANVGFFSLFAARLVGTTGRVVAFEPHPANAETLRYHVNRNRLANVQCIEAAVSDNDGYAMLGGAGSTARLGLDNGVRVATVSVDRLRASGTLPRPSLVKIDVEGWEYPVLMGMHDTLVTDRPVILIEFHGAMRDGIDWDTRCRELLAARDYLVSRLPGGETVGIPRERSSEARVT